MGTEDSEHKNDSTTQTIKVQMDSEGYIKGIVKVLKDSDCPFIIIDETSRTQLDPINFDLPEFAEYKNDGIKIYFKYKPLRRMNRCNDASPIEVESIKKRED